MRGKYELFQPYSSSVEKGTVGFFLASVVILSISGSTQAQDIPQFELPVSSTGLTLLSARDKPKKIESLLLELANQYTNNPFLQLPQTATEPSIAFNGGLIAIDATSLGSVDALLSDLQNLGLVGGSAFGKLVSGQLPLASINSAKALNSLNFMHMARPFTRIGAAYNQADIAMGSDTARINTGVDGTGVTIGILSDSYDQLSGEAADILSGDIPVGVLVLDDTALGQIIDEGRAMAQLIHDVAPGADLIFHTAFNGQASFAQGILDLANAGADVIVDDVGNLGAPMFQDGIIAQAVDQVVAGGVAYFSSAGNMADTSYEAPYYDSGQTAGTSLSNLHSFTPGDPTDVLQEIIIESGGSVFLSVQWDEPFSSAGGVGSASDIDVILVDSLSNVLASGVNPNIGGDAFEIVTYTNSGSSPITVGLIIGVYDGPVPGRIKWIDFGGAKTTSPQSGASTIFGHANSAGAIATGATRYDLTPAFGVTPPVLESFSSVGGLEVLFDTAGSLLSVPDDRTKPEIVAPDGVDTTFFGSPDFDGTGFPNFFGTSAAAPNAAAVAALQLQCDPLLTPSGILAQQTNSAIDMESTGFDYLSGNGLINASAAVGAACSTSIVECNGLPVTVDMALGQSPTNGDDVIQGTLGDDVIVALGGDDTICGLAGDDIINSGPGADFVDAGAGDDQVFGLDGDDVIYGDDGNDVIVSGNGDDFLDGENGDDLLNGGPGNDTIDGGNGDDDIFGQAGNDMLDGGNDDDLVIGVGGVDTIEGGNGDDVLNGGEGDDTINGGAGNDTLFGLTGNDLLYGGFGDDQVFGQIGADTISGGGGNDELFGNQGDDVVTATSGTNTINGGPGNDTITGGSGDDEIFGDGDLLQAGNDVIDGGAGSDLIVGFAGADTITADDGIADVVNGGPGVDSCATDTLDTVFNCP